MLLQPFLLTSCFINKGWKYRDALYFHTYCRNSFSVALIHLFTLLIQRAVVKRKALETQKHRFETKFPSYSLWNPWPIWIFPSLCFLTYTKTKNLQRYWQVSFLLRPLSLACRWLSSPYVFTWFLFCAYTSLVSLCVSKFLFFWGPLRLN